MLGGRTHSGSRDIDCEPIPLTEEWLVSFGFESEGLGYEINDRFLTVISEEDEGFNVLIMTADFESLCILLSSSTSTNYKIYISL